MRQMPTHEQLQYLTSVGVEASRLAPEGQPGYVPAARSGGMSAAHAAGVPAPARRRRAASHTPPLRRSAQARHRRPAPPGWVWYVAGPAAFLAGYVLFQLIG